MKWSPIETAPKDGTKFLAWDVEDGQQVAMYSSTWVNAMQGDYSYTCIWPTHWMPLPENPNDGNE